MTEYEIFVARLKELMSEEGVTANQLASKLGLMHKTVDGWLSDGYFPRVENLLKLSAHYRSNIDFLLGLCDEDRLPETVDSVDFSRRFEQLIAEFSYKSNKIARACGVQPSTVSKWRKNGNVPDTLSLIRLSKLFHCSVEYLLGRVD